MVNLSLKLDESIFHDAEKFRDTFKISRNAYINEALLYYNKIKRQEYLEKEFKKAVELCKDSSLEMNKVMDHTIEDGLENL